MLSMLYDEFFIFFILFFKVSTILIKALFYYPWNQVMLSRTSMRHVVMREKALWQFHHQDDAQNNGQSDFAGHPPGL